MHGVWCIQAPQPLLQAILPEIGPESALQTLRQHSQRCLRRTQQRTDDGVAPPRRSSSLGEGPRWDFQGRVRGLRCEGGRPLRSLWPPRNDHQQERHTLCARAGSRSSHGYSEGNALSSVQYGARVRAGRSIVAAPVSRVCRESSAATHRAPRTPTWWLDSFTRNPCQTSRNGHRQPAHHRPEAPAPLARVASQAIRSAEAGLGPTKGQRPDLIRSQLWP